MSLDSDEDADKREALVLEWSRPQEEGGDATRPEPDLFDQKGASIMVVVKRRDFEALVNVSAAQAAEAFEGHYERFESATESTYHTLCQKLAGLLLGHADKGGVSTDSLPGFWYMGVELWGKYARTYMHARARSCKTHTVNCFSAGEHPLS